MPVLSLNLPFCSLKANLARSVGERGGAKIFDRVAILSIAVRPNDFLLGILYYLSFGLT